MCGKKTGVFAAGVVVSLILCSCGGTGEKKAAKVNIDELKEKVQQSVQSFAANDKEYKAYQMKVEGVTLIAPDPKDKAEPSSIQGSVAVLQGNKTYEIPISVSPALDNLDWGAVLGGVFPPIPMVFVEGGDFTMGCADDKECQKNEKPTHTVTVGGFYIGKYEVTQKQWNTIMADPNEAPKVSRLDYIFGDVRGSDEVLRSLNARKKSAFSEPNFKGDDLPVENVSWDDVSKFIAKLNEKTGKKFRLPTEAEWEYAARGGAKSKGYKYSGSNDVNEVAWHAANSERSSRPVGTKAPNELGIYDMSGNVYEWCFDGQRPFNAGSQTNPMGPTAANASRVDRGCSWSRAAKDCRVAYRGNPDPSNKRANDIGFRVALSE